MKFLKSSLSFAWLEFKALKFYPSNLVLFVIQSFVTTGIWFFVSLFLKDYAKGSLKDFGGDFVAYMVIGVIFFQNAANILSLPFQSLSTAFWDKRLEIYNSSSRGIWAFITGRFIWNFFYNLVIQFCVMLFAIFAAGVNVSKSIPVLPAIAFYLLFVLTCFGIGLIGAGNFFYLEVKQGREPVTWLTDVLARIFSGVYYPLSVLPASIGFVSYFVPHTYALQGIRLVLIGGNGFDNAMVRNDLFMMLLFCAFSLFTGIFVLNSAIAKAERTNGVGMVI